MLVDSHCHLNFPDFKDDLDGVIRRAREAGVRIIQTICTEMAEFNEIYAIAERYEGVYCSVGVHPNDSGKAELPSVAQLVEKCRLPKVTGIGETGLDYHYETTDREHQRESLLVHIEAARQTGLPLIVHTRAADEDTISIISDELKKGYFKGLIHCFSSSKYLAEKMVELGFYISISGIATFKNATEIRETIECLPLERLLVETDAPFLAPVPHRGKRNEPAFTKYTNQLVAQLKGIGEEQSASITTENFFRLFDKAIPPTELAA